MTDRECRCGRPTRDQAYVCDDCAHRLNVALADVPWLADELETTTTKAKGVDYRSKGGTAATERPSPVAWSASDARTHLKAVLVSWVKFCDDEHVRHSSPHQGLPRDRLPAISRWLMWRVDGLTLHDIGPDAVEEITEAVATCHRLIDKPAEKQYLGPCQACNDGRLYAKPHATWAKCETCGHAIDAEQLRSSLLKQLEDRLCTASEIARLSTYLGLKANRDQVRNRINQWHSRDIITSESIFDDEPAFRFGDIYERLVEDEYRPTRRGKQAS